jgi:hypothetical protein
MMSTFPPSWRLLTFHKASYNLIFFVLMPAESLAIRHDLQHLRDELEQLKRAQDEAMSLAVYLGMTPAQAESFDKRRRRIQSIYEALLNSARSKEQR